MSSNIRIAGATYLNVPAIDLKTTTGETVRFYPESSGGSSGGSSGPNVQGYHGMASVTATSYTTTGVKLTVAKTGVYKVSWMGCRNTNSGTSGSQLYINNSSYGSAQTTFSNTYAQSVELSNVSLTAGQTVEVRARARSTSYRMMVGNLIIEQTN